MVNRQRKWKFNCKVNDKVAFNTKGDPGHLYLAVKAQKYRKWEIFGFVIY